MVSKKGPSRTNRSNKLDSVEKAILSHLDQGKTASIQELLKDLEEYPESEIRSALWALLAASEIDVSPDYSLRRHAVCV
jgi:hypothetical protein